MNKIADKAKLLNPLINRANYATIDSIDCVSAITYAIFLQGIQNIHVQFRILLFGYIS